MGSCSEIEATASTRPPNGESNYDAFLSYRRLDAAYVARRLSSKLRRYRLPSDVAARLSRDGSNELEPLTVFADVLFERSSEDFWTRKILPALERARYLIVISTPDALRARADGSVNWVWKEIETFLDLKKAGALERIILVLGPNAPENRFPGQLEKLSSTWDWVDLRSLKWYRSFSPSAWNTLDNGFAKIAATLYGVPDDLLPALRQEESRRRSSRILVVAALALTVAFITSALARWAITERTRAIREETRTQLELSAQANRDMLGTREAQDALANSLRDSTGALDALGYVPLSTANALRAALEGAREITRVPLGGQPNDLHVDWESQVASIVTRDGWVLRLSLEGEERQEWRAAQEQGGAHLTPSGRGVVARTPQGTEVRTLDGTRLVTLDVPGDAHEPPLDYCDAIVLDRRAGTSVRVESNTRIIFADELFPDLRAQPLAQIQCTQDGSVVLVVPENGDAEFRAAPLTQRLPASSKFGSDLSWHLDEDGHIISFGDSLDIHSIDGQLRASIPWADVSEVATSPTANRIAVTFENADEIRIVNYDGNETNPPIRGHLRPSDAAISPLGDRLVTTGYLDATMRSFDLRDPHVRRLFTHPKGEFTSALDLCETERIAILGSGYGSMAFVSIDEGWSVLRERAHPTYVEGVACVGSGRVISVGRDGPLRIWTTKGDPLREFSADAGSFEDVVADEHRCLAFLATREAVYSLHPCSEDPALTTVLDRETLSHMGMSVVRSLAIATRGQVLVVGGDASEEEGANTGKVAFWSYADGLSLVREVPLVGVWQPLALAIDSKETRVAAAGIFDAVDIISVVDGSVKTISSIDTAIVWSAAMGPGERIFVTGDQGKVRLFRPVGGELYSGIERFVGKSMSRVHSLDDTEQILFTGSDGDLFIEDLGSSGLVRLACERLRRSERKDGLGCP